ncbi:hypothetical protein [Rosettibacter firmus]|uniref:hypothetical protein n=1 Tax=Rosettibacter firmus TaxID=3111522 RepID=UPI00336C1026
MKKINFLLLVIIILTGCAGAEFINVKRVSKSETQTVKKDITKILQLTNPRFLDKVLSTMTLPDNLFNNITPDDKIIIQSVDRNYVSDEDLQLVVYRALIDKLLKKHITILDRDENILSASFAESDNHFEKSWLVYKQKYADSLVSFSNEKFLKATKILGYRILEFGQTFVPIDTVILQRIGIVELEIRLVDANTTQILYLDRIYNTYHDHIPLKDYQIIADLHFGFISDALPLVKNVQTKNILNLPVEEKVTTLPDVIEITFLRGTRESDVEIIHRQLNKIIARFQVPRKEFNNIEYVYSLNLVDDKNIPLPPGDYSIFIDNILVHTFTYKEQ